MLRGLVLLCVLTALGCKRAPEAAPDVAEAAAPVDPLVDMHKVLSRRDPEPTCAEAAGSRTDPVPDFLTLVEQGGAPAWVPMRAASCVIEHSGVLVGHVGGSSTPGLGIGLTGRARAFSDGWAFPEVGHHAFVMADNDANVGVYVRAGTLTTELSGSPVLGDGRFWAGLNIGFAIGGVEE